MGFYSDSHFFIDNNWSIQKRLDFFYKISERYKLEGEATMTIKTNSHWGHWREHIIIFGLQICDMYWGKRISRIGIEITLFGFGFEVYSYKMAKLLVKYFKYPKSIQESYVNDLGKERFSATIDLPLNYK